MLARHLLLLVSTAIACGGDDGPSGTATSSTTPTTAATQADDSGGSSSDASASTSVSTSADPTTSADDGSTSVASSIGDSGSSTGPGDTTGSPSSVCDDIAGADFIVPGSCDGPSGNTSTEVPRNGMFATSWFGCYFDDNGDIVQDASDNCEFACGDQGLCPGQDGPNCEANLQWFAADADRFGCGGRIRVTNCENGNSVVLVTLDRGPNCAVEMDCGAPVLDMSHDAMVYLFEGAIYGGCDLQAVVVEPVDESTELGPV